MCDLIKIKDLEIYANHGVYPEENKLGQKFLVSAELVTSFSAAADNDDLGMSVDYGDVCHKISEFMTAETFKLIETAAVRLAEMLLKEYSLVSGVCVEIKKPWAPIGLPVDYVSVRTELEWHTAYIALGSNIGEREKYIRDAVNRLGSADGCVVESVSDLIVTEPYGGVEQEDFLNGALKLKTFLSPQKLLKLLNKIESEADRKREVHWGPRTLDLDIIFYDDKIIDTEELHIPHIDMQNRIFVLEPMCEIAPYFRHPLLGKTMKQLLDELA